MPIEKSKVLKLFPDHYKWLGENFKLSREVGLVSEEIEQAIPGIELLEVPKFVSVIKEGETGDDLFVIFKGQVSINKEKPFLGSVEVVRLGEGDYFGEIALLGSQARTATVTTEKDSLVFRLPAGEVRALLDRKPLLAEHLKKVAAARLAKLAEVVK